MQTSEPNWEKTLAAVEPRINADGVHVWPFDLSFPIDVRFFNLDSCQNIRMNRHDYFEIFYVHSGRAVCQVQERRFQLRKGDLAVIGSSLYHRLIGHDSQPLKFIALFFLPELVQATETTGDGMEYMMPFFSQNANFPHVISASTGLPAQVVELIKRIQAELPAVSNRARLAVKTYLKMILMLLVNHYAAYLGNQETSYHRLLSIRRLRPLFEYLEEHYDLRIRIEDAARICATSSSHFMYFFKQLTGQSFLAYLNQFRIAKARWFLTSTERPISEISQEVGFCDQSHFGVVFRKLVGMTPLGYRRRFRDVNEGVLASSVDQFIPRHRQVVPEMRPIALKKEMGNSFPPVHLPFEVDRV